MFELSKNSQFLRKKKIVLILSSELIKQALILFYCLLKYKKIKMKKHIVLITLTLLLGTHLSAQKGDKYFTINKNLSVFNSILKELNNNYVDSIDYDKLIKSGIDNMLRTLDPYTVYIPESENDQLKIMTSGKYGGIGSLIMKRGNQVIISELYKGMPAQKNGLKAGDVIKEVDGVSTVGKTTSQVSNLLRGKHGTKIKIKIERPYEKGSKTFRFLRENIQFNPISYATVVADKIGYIILKDFTDKAASQLKIEVESMIKKDSIHSLIIDLRNNGGGLINEAVKILGYFLPKGTTVVTTKGRDQKVDNVYKTPTDPIFGKIKLAILVNRGSASASEILAGAIQDLDRGIIIGERTFGKGLVQNVRPVGYGGYLKTTTAKYYIPSGRCVQALDYAHRNKDGSVGTIPDSLINSFKTKNGRIVKDGGGILPDTVTVEKKNFNISFYFYIQNIYFDYATRFVHNHKTIEKPSKFKLNDKEFQKFVNYVIKEKKFTYTTQTQKYFQQLQKMTELDGYDKSLQQELKQLKEKLKPDIAKSIEKNKDEIVKMLSMEIIQRYYYERGQIEYMLKDDKEVKVAINSLRK